jgi:hypothetical protein
MIAAKNEQLGWAPPCAGFHLSCAGHEVRLVQRTPEILCVQLQSQNAFNGSLQRFGDFDPFAAALPFNALNALAPLGPLGPLDRKSTV